MKRIITGALTALTLAGAVAATTAPASAQPWHGGYHRGWGPGAAVGAGLLGLAVGASLAAPHYGYGYAAPAYGPGYYGAGYYGPAAYGCRAHLRWNPYWGGYQRVRACY